MTLAIQLKILQLINVCSSKSKLLRAKAVFVIAYGIYWYKWLSRIVTFVQTNLSTLRLAWPACSVYSLSGSVRRSLGTVQTCYVALTVQHSVHVCLRRQVCTKYLHYSTTPVGKCLLLPQTAGRPELRPASCTEFEHSYPD